MTSRPSTAAPILIAMLALSLPAIYVAAYIGMYDPDAPLEMQDVGVCEQQHYRYGNGFCRVFFAPLQSVDWRKSKFRGD